MTGLGERQQAEYWRRGYVHVPGLLDSAEVSALQAECRRLTEGDALAEGDRIDPVLARSPVLQKLLEKDALVGSVRSVLGDEPSLFKDKLILKPPGAGGFDVHQDFAYYGWTGIPADGVLALQIAVDDADEANGAVRFCAGRHDALLGAVADRDAQARAALKRAGDDEIVRTRAGDAVLFHSLTPHWSDDNRSDRSRRTLYLTYNAAALGDLYRIYYQDRGAVLP